MRHELLVGALWGGLSIDCTCGWSGGRMLDDIDYMPVWDAHRSGSTP